MSSFSCMCLLSSLK
uniref:Uncharacterized protein n=1 Tax=Arundo donax TaxID=35708 RepID=A0A0A9A5E4_ARUDO